MYRLNEEQQPYLAKIQQIATDTIGPNADTTDANGTFPSASMDALAQAGALGLNVPTGYGGWGQGMRLACAALDTIGQQCASTGMVYLMHLCGVACYAAQAEAASDELRAAVRGEHLSTLAWSEKGSRSHFWAPLSQAVGEGNTVKLSAEKSWVTREALGFLPAERIFLNPDCGFATFSSRPMNAAEIARGKLEAVVAAARKLRE